MSIAAATTHDGLVLRSTAEARASVTLAEWVGFHVIDTERQDWARGHAALRRSVERIPQPPWARTRSKAQLFR
ncbi:hypothetical protein ACFV4T_03950 [Streptomyces sp. NPDC059755]|uniref:hypothetical protein n=1 Tax=Streptomyces sp. NPDC059755 TaxID=3346934 RepID=UPI00365BFB07